MAKSTFNWIQIGGVVTCVPPLEKCIDDEVELFGGNLKQIAQLKKTIGLDRRRVVEAGTTAADFVLRGGSTSHGGSGVAG